MLRDKHLRTFFIIWFGQLVSLIGTGMTRFAVLIWAYQQTEQATSLALLGFFAFVPYAIFSPVAGVLVDRYDRRKVMLISDSLVGVVTIVLLVLFRGDQLLIWHLFVAEFLIGTFESFQTPAYAAATTMLVPKDQLTRANGLQALALNASRVAAPFIGGALLPFIKLDGIMLIDVTTFMIAVVTLLLVRVPMPPSEDAVSAENTSTLATISFGLRYIWARPGLRGLMLLFAVVHLLAAVTYFGVLPAMVLARSGGNELALASVQGALGIGGVLGAALMTLWGGTKRKIDTVLLGMALSFLFGDLILGFGRNPLTWAVGAFIAQLFIPPLSSANTAIWQLKTPPHLQGRVFAAKEAIITVPFALGFLLAGPLADRVFEPAMAVGGAWAGQFNWLVGSGAGAGMGLMFIGTGTLGTLLALTSYLSPAIRNVEIDLIDYDLEPSAEVA